MVILLDAPVLIFRGKMKEAKGDGMVKLDMQFLADVYIPCESCQGMRYNRETLEVRFRR